MHDGTLMNVPFFLFLVTDRVPNRGGAYLLISVYFTFLKVPIVSNVYLQKEVILSYMCCVWFSR